MAETLSLHVDDISQAEQERMLGSILRQTRLLDSITADLLAAGQAQHGTLAMQMEEVDATELVRSVIDDDLDLTLVEDSRSHLLTDPLRFQQMLSNLLSNARKYGAPPLLVRITSQGRQVSIDVEDNGPGVPEDFRPRLFQEYSRALAPPPGAPDSACSWFAPWPRPRAAASPTPPATRRDRCSR